MCINPEWQVNFGTTKEGLLAGKCAL